MEDLLVAAVAGALSGVAGGATGEAGAEAWNQLRARIRSRLGPRSHADELAAEIEAGTEQAAVELLSLLETDADLYEELSDFAIAFGTKHGSTNTVNGDVHGTVIQADHIGSVSIHPANETD